MVETRRIGKYVLIRLSIVLVVVLSGVAVGSGGLTLQGEPAMNINSPVGTVEDGASVVKYEELSGTQQEQFRDAVAGSGYITSGYQQIESIDYVYLDGEYYPTEESEYYTNSGIIGVILGLLWVGVGSVIGLFVGVSLISGSFAFVLAVAGVEPEELEIWWGSVKGKIAVLIIVVGVVGTLVAPVAFNIQHTSVVKYEDSPPEDLEVTGAEELSEVESDMFREVAGGGSMLGSDLAEYEVIKSDGEYYVVKESYPLSVASVIVVGSVLVFVEVIVLAIVVVLVEGVKKELYGETSLLGAYN